jgi:hypothetical protein
MAEKKFLSWVGFKEATPVAKAEGASSENSGSSTPNGSQSTVSRIRELENQLAELRARRDITSLTKEEFEIKGLSEIEKYEFNQGAVYACCNKKPHYNSHKGHTFRYK